MCTVSIAPLCNGYAFTFNRDEQPGRYSPQFINRQVLPDKELFYAKDSKAGGSWFVADSIGNVAMLFNGAFTKHARQEVYSKSRGILLLEIAAANNMLACYQDECLQGVAPFSILLFENNKLYRLSWDGAIKHAHSLSGTAYHIFSSATLYTKEVQQQREKWFAAWMDAQPVTSERVYQFHREYKEADTINGLVIQRPGGCDTLSISQLVLTKEAGSMRHTDLVKGKEHLFNFLVPKNASVFV